MSTSDRLGNVDMLTEPADEIRDCIYRAYGIDVLDSETLVLARQASTLQQMRDMERLSPTEQREQEDKLIAHILYGIDERNVTPDLCVTKGLPMYGKSPLSAVTKWIECEESINAARWQQFQNGAKDDTQDTTTQATEEAEAQAVPQVL